MMQLLFSPLPCEQSQSQFSEFSEFQPLCAPILTRDVETQDVTQDERDNLQCLEAAAPIVKQRHKVSQKDKGDM